jgi:hypothetical protein
MDETQTPPVETPTPTPMPHSTEEPRADQSAQEHPEDLKPAETTKQTNNEPKQTKLKNLKQLYLKKKKFTIPATVLVILIIILAIPWSRYKILGLFIKQSVTINVTDSTTNTPVSGAKINFNGVIASTDGGGKATTKVKVGDHPLTITKQYYKTYQVSKLVSLTKSKNIYAVSLVANGRQVPITVLNKINGAPAVGIKIQILDTEATTDKDGKATLVVPTTTATQKASFQGSGFNNMTAEVTATNNVVPANTFNVTPAGVVYFLSNASGKLDVVKTNLDGTNRQTVLSGTGKEDSRNTALLATKDWKYLALLSKRDGGSNAKLFLINTSADKLTTIDEGNASFTLTGWGGHNFAYQVYRNDIPEGQPKQQALKSYNADGDKLTTLDETTAETTASGYLYQNYENAYIINNQVVFSENWYANYQISNFNKQATLSTVGLTGGTKQVAKSFALAPSTQNSSVYIQTHLYAPNSIDIYFNDGQKTTFYGYENGQVTTDAAMTNDAFFNNPYPTYLQSPSGKLTFWAEPRDGKNTLFLGDTDGGNKKQIATASEYNSYGWFTENYLLVSKNGSELYVLGTTPNSKALKISDYYKPALSFNGYGGGYGGQ